MELRHRTDLEDGRVVYVYSIPDLDMEMPVYQSDILSGMVTKDEVYHRLCTIRDEQRIMPDAYRMDA